jgi:tRNA/rRNA methyltransferase
LLLKGELDVRSVPEVDAGLTDNLPTSGAACNQKGVAFLFGCERFGMSNDDVYRCDVALSIPSNPQFGSLNLGSAIQVVAYDWRVALGGFPVVEHTPRRIAPTWPRCRACWATGSRPWPISAFWTRQRPRSSCPA